MKSTTMKKSAVAVMAACLVAGSASAMTLWIDRVEGYHPVGSLGGEFSIFGTGLEANYAAVATASKGGNTGFQSFCLEFNEAINLGGQYDYTIGTGAIMGGVAGGNPDPLGIGTAWLYQQFATGVLADYNYVVPGAGRETSAGLLQDAIWYLEEELGPVTETEITGNIFLQAVVAKYGDIATAQADASMSDLQKLRVRVINPTDMVTGAPRQSQLVYGVPDGGLTLGLLGLSLVSLGHIRRRLRI